VPEPGGVDLINKLDRDTLRLLMQHGQLRPLLTAIITEEQLDPLELDASAQQEAIANYRQRHNLDNAEEIKRHCHMKGYDKEQFLDQVNLLERIRRTSQDRYGNKAELHYLTRKEQFDQVTFSQLIVRNENLAQEMFLRLSEDEETFEELALSLSRGSQRKPQWRIGPIPMSRVPKPMFRAFRGISPGKLLEPIQIQKNWHVIRLDNYQPSEFDAAMNQQMCIELFQQKVTTAVSEQISIIKTKLSINSES
jgi:parvulin-like peptidyl-prolyl isomerase